MSMLTIKVSVEEPVEKRQKKQEKEFEEFLHKYRDLLRPDFVYDPVRMRMFMMEKDRIMRELDLGLREKMLIQRMVTNVRSMEERKRYEIIGHDDFHGLWFLG